MENIINGSADSIDTDLSISKPSVLENARKLVQDKTRFEPQELQPTGEPEDRQQPYEITVTHALSAEPTVQSITGHFVPSSEDRLSKSPVGDAKIEVVPQLQEAAAQLKAALAEPLRVYNQVEPGVLLHHPHKHWLLLPCTTCIGRGRLQCNPCAGAGKVTCYSCFGRRTVSCNRCGGSGRRNCSSCNGTGRLTRQVPKTVSASAYVNGSWRTEYKTVYVTENYSCSACTGGKVSCSSCFGSGHVSCPTCFASGKVTCKNCGGSGDVRCDPCEGSGLKGTATWVDVHVEPIYALTLPEDTPADVIAMTDKEGLHELPPISARFEFRDAAIHTTEGADSPNAVSATYNGDFRVSRQEVACSGETAFLIAYGNDLRWWSLDGIIERLLEDDLKALSNAVDVSAKEGLFSTRLYHLLESLKHVIASEINVDMVEAALSKRGDDLHRGAVSAEYAAKLSRGIQDALRRIYLRRAKTFAWQTTLATLLFGLSTWAFFGVWWAAGVVCTALPTGFFLHRWAIRNLLSEVLGSPKLALRAMSVAGKGSGGREAALLMALPSLVLAGFLTWALPAPPFGKKGPVEPAQQASIPTQAPVPKTLKVTAVPRHKVKSATKTRTQAAPAPQPVTGSADVPLDATNEMNLQTAQQMYDKGIYRIAYTLANIVLSRYPHNARAAQLVSSAHEKISQDMRNHSVPQPAFPTAAGASGGNLDPISESWLNIAEMNFKYGDYQTSYDDAQIVLKKYPSNERAIHVATAAQKKMGKNQGQ